MGFFSWMTSDTEESIANIHTGHCRPVYLLQPGGQEPICEPAYDGFGVFGGVDAYVWLAKANLPADLEERIGDDQALRALGFTMADGTVCRDTQTGEIWSIRYSLPEELGIFFKNFPHSWMTVIPEIGLSPSELCENGRFERVKLRELLEIKFPLKFSFDKDAVYEDVSPAKNCPHQGYFLPEQEDNHEAQKYSKPINTMKL